jgi:hypothetical protein
MGVNLPKEFKMHFEGFFFFLPVLQTLRGQSYEAWTRIWNTNIT